MSAIQSSFESQLGFPNVPFVQAAIGAYFGKAAYVQVTGGPADFAFEHPETREKWIIEAIGLAAAGETDIRTGLGQILCRMDGSPRKYGLALPLTSQFLAACRLIHPHIRRALNLHLLLVDSHGNVTGVKPGQPIPTF